MGRGKRPESRGGIGVDLGGRGLWLLAKSRKHRKFEFGEWKKASGVELGAEKDRDEGKLRESIRRYGGTWSAGKTWELGAEKNRCGVCVCLSVPVRPSVHARTDWEKENSIKGEDY